MVVFSSAKAGLLNISRRTRDSSRILKFHKHQDESLNVHKKIDRCQINVTIQSLCVFISSNSSVPEFPEIFFVIPSSSTSIPFASRTIGIFPATKFLFNTEPSKGIWRSDLFIDCPGSIILKTETLLSA